MKASPICKPTGKRIYKRHQDADKALGALAKIAVSGLAQVPRASYQCAACRRWHLTSESPEDVRHYCCVQRLRAAPREATG